jgi:hypothetical protein
VFIIGLVQEIIADASRSQLISIAFFIAKMFFLENSKFDVEFSRKNHESPPLSSKN